MLTCFGGGSFVLGIGSLTRMVRVKGFFLDVFWRFGVEVEIGFCSVLFFWKPTRRLPYKSAPNKTRTDFFNKPQNVLICLCYSMKVFSRLYYFFVIYLWILLIHEIIVIFILKILKKISIVKFFFEPLNLINHRLNHK